jgi:anti-anti-sigma factor
MDIAPRVVITSRTSGDVVIMDVQGEFSRGTAAPPTLSEIVKTHLGTGKRWILVNFESVGFVDSFGVRELLNTYSAIQDIGGMLKICRLPDKFLLVLKITGIDKVLKLYPTETAALEAFGEKSDLD